MDLLPPWYTSDYRWPGLLLFMAFGVGPVVAGVLLLTHRRRGWQAVTLTGVVLLIWMLAQLGMIGLMLPPVQLFCIAVGVILTAVGGWKSLGTWGPGTPPG